MFPKTLFPNKPSQSLARLATLCGALLLAGCDSQESKDKRIEESLIKGFTKVADEFNAKGPVMMDEHTRLERTEVGPGARITYHYSLPGYAAAELAEINFLDSITPELTSGLCDDKDVRTTLKQGATYSFIYVGNDKVEIARLDVTAANCKNL